MNFAELAGFLGADAEERFTPTGKRVISLRLATRGRKGETIWWRINIWDDRFDKMLPYLRKGTALIVFGEILKPETYQDKEGKVQVALSLNAEVIRFSPFGKPEGKQEQAGTFGATAATPAYVGSGPETPEMGDELPF